MTHFCGSPRMAKFIETERSNGACQGLGEGKWKIVFNGYGVVVWEDGKVPEGVGDDGSTAT